jgi:hypothetical protein
MVMSSTKRVHSLDHELQPTLFSAMDGEGDLSTWTRGIAIER